MSSKSNRLKDEKSPYLLQHQDNPVHWQAWGEEAFAASKKENKPIFLSIGYSTCHWCHVMAHESFEDQGVANILNYYFIPIKVDREERPDVDEIYMAAIHAMGQRGGWPLSMFLTPSLKPFYGGTYWPREQFLMILEKLATIWKHQPEKIEESGKQIFEHVQAQKNAELGEVNLSEETFKNFYKYSEATFDRHWGGFGQAPKFPHPMQLSLLLRIHRRSQDPTALDMVTHTLNQMARGGIYDQIGGGFARYSTDERWLIPHFEKMLYDNALLTKVYLEAYQTTKNPNFLRIAQEVLDYILRDMISAEGGFYSAEDADSEGEEGKFYVWTYDEIKNLLSAEEFKIFEKTYAITTSGNFEHQTNNLSLKNELDGEEKKNPLLRSAIQKLFEARSKRIRPHLDDKILTSWNSLMLSAFALAYQVCGEKKYLEALQKNTDFLLNKSGLYQNQKLFARYRGGEARFNGYLDDYAYLIQALLDVYQTNFDSEILKTAIVLQSQQDKLFWDPEKGGYFFSDGSDPSILVRSKEAGDNAIPNGNAISALNLLKLFEFTGEAAYRNQALTIFKVFSKIMVEYPHACPQLLIAYDYLTDETKQLVMSSSEIPESFLKTLHQEFIPNKILAWTNGKKDFPALVKNKTPKGKTAYYVCEAGACQAPTQEEKEVLEKINFSKLYYLKG